MMNGKIVNNKTGINSATILRHLRFLKYKKDKFNKEMKKQNKRKNAILNLFSQKCIPIKYMNKVKE